MGEDHPDDSAGGSQRYDLGERTAQFGEAVVRFARGVPVDAITSSLITQLVRAGTSVGANYGEADEAGSRKEFRYRISLCRREARESKHWLRTIVVAVPGAKSNARALWCEANQLTKIFAAIHRKGDKEGES